jgi:hypothetical protein
LPPRAVTACHVDRVGVVADLDVVAEVADAGQPSHRVLGGPGATAASAAAGLIVSVSWLMIFVLRSSVSHRAFFHWPLVTNSSPGMVLRAQPLG